MSRPHRPPRLLALAAAYVIVLQALLLPLSVAAGSTFVASPCSASTTTGGAPSPASHPSGCPCAAGCGMHCHFHALAAPVPTLVSVRRVPADAPLALRLHAPATPSDAPAHRFARGPPAA